MHKHVFHLHTLAKTQQFQRIVNRPVGGLLSQQRKQVHGLAGLLCLFDGGNEHGIFAKRAVLHSVFQPDVVLRHHAPRANVQMPRFGVARLAVFEANGVSGGAQITNGVVLYKIVPNRRFRKENRVGLVFLSHAPAVQNNQQNFACLFRPKLRFTKHIGWLLNAKSRQHGRGYVAKRAVRAVRVE